MMRLNHCPKNTHITPRSERPKHLTFDFRTVGTIVKSYDVDYHDPRTKTDSTKSEEEHSSCSETEAADKEKK